MQRLDTPIQDFGETGNLLHGAYLEARLLEAPLGAASAEQLHAQC